MVPSWQGHHDGGMNETQERPDQADDQDRFDPHRLRTITDMRRSRDDRVVAGVCSGAAKYLNVDPVVIRVVIAVLTFVGLAGVILYLAAWFLLPAEGTGQDGAGHSIAADWFNLDKNEEQVRVVGLIGAAVVAAIAVVGNSDWAWWGIPWVLVPIAGLYWLFVVRRRRRRTDPDGPAPDGPAPAASPDDTAILPNGTVDAERATVQERRKDPAPGLSVLTLSVAAIAVAVTVLVGQATDGIDWTTYVAIGLGVVAVGLLVGTVFGRPGPLVPVGLLLAVVLAVGSLLPNGAMGERIYTPASAAEVVGSYEHGVGKLELDLTDVTDAAQLTGSTVHVKNGIGETRVIVPHDLNVVVDADLRAGEIRAFDKKVNGTHDELVYPADDPGAPALTLRIHQTFGNIEVMSR
jgi:phage shock protein PspC (stress-responsive transcriptional regulator)